MKQFLIELSGQRRYWIALALIGIALEAAGLYYQYALDEWPCVLCIHVRIWVLAFVLLAIAGIFTGRSPMASRLLHGVNTLIMLALVERSWQVLAVERGWTFGDCDMDLGMPAWFALDKWFPWIFEVKTSCGYSPLVLFQITMAESLLVIMVLLAVISSVLFLVSFLSKNSV